MFTKKMEDELIAEDEVDVRGNKHNIYWHAESELAMLAQLPYVGTVETLEKVLKGIKFGNMNLPLDFYYESRHYGAYLTEYADIDNKMDAFKFGNLHDFMNAFHDTVSLFHEHKRFDLLEVLVSKNPVLFFHSTIAAGDDLEEIQYICSNHTIPVEEIKALLEFFRSREVIYDEVIGYLCEKYEDTPEGIY
jgi:hypothetical protein